MANDPIFIVGTPRSGTTLLAAMLSSHSRIACGPETHFFHEVEAMGILKTIITDKKWPKEAMNFLLSLHLGKERLIDLYGLNQNDIHNFLISKPQSLNSTLEALTELYTQKVHKFRWVEKTPRHLLHVQTIRRLYPVSPIIRIIRDPRGVALSLEKVPWASNSLICNAVRWLTDECASQVFFKRDIHCLIVKYEELVQHPNEEMKRICNFIDEKFEPQMTTPGETGKSLIGKGEWWKKNVTGSIDRSRIGVWKNEMNHDYAKAITFLCFNELKKYGYEVFDRPKRHIILYPTTNYCIENNEEFFVDATKYHTALIPCYSYKQIKKILSDEMVNGLIILGLPEICNEIRINKLLQRVINISGMLFLLVVARLKKKKVFWETKPFNKLNRNKKLKKVFIGAVKYIFRNVETENFKNFLKKISLQAEVS